MIVGGSDAIHISMNTNSTSQKSAAPPLDASVLDGLPDPVILVDPGHVIVDYNRAARLLLGRDAFEAPLSDFLANDHIGDEIDARLAGTPATSSEVFLPYPVARHFELNVWRLPDLTSPGPAWAMLVLRDITAPKKAAQLRADFVANVSHELRSPLSSLLGFIETLRGPAAGDKEATARFLEIMEAEAKRMTRLVSDLLALSKVETDEHIRPETPIDLQLILSLIANTLSVRAAEREMTIVIEGMDNIPRIVGESDELTQVFQNLVSNALSYGRSGTPIRICVEDIDFVPGTTDPGITVSVVNQGDGITADEIPRLTERFYRVDKGRSRSMGGTGLGLAIVKHIVARHRGDLHIESTPGEDTRFSVSLPRAVTKAS